MYELREVKYVDQVPKKEHCLLAADIGGTNSNFGFFVLYDDTFKLLFSVHAKSQDVVNFTDLVKQVLEYALSTYQITVTHSCFAGAGVVSSTRDYCKPTNLNFAIDAHEILAKTSLHCAIVVNDFEVIGHGIPVIDQSKLVQVNVGNPQHYANRGIVGAGTGLGKCSLLWDVHSKRYMPLPSEGGHADFAVQHKLEYDLIEFIRTTEHRFCNISWEDVLSGYGIKRMYNFFKTLNQSEKAHQELAKNGLHPDMIFKSRTLDNHAMNTYKLYQTFYARCAKSFALDALTLGGLYIAGGIAAKNLELFQDSGFIAEFTNCGKQQDLLKKIPIYVITDYNVSLYGAAAYMVLEGLCK